MIRSDDRDGQINRLSGRVEREIYLGEIIEYVIGTEAGLDLIMRVGPKLRMNPGEQVTLRLPPEKTIAILAT